MINKKLIEVVMVNLIRHSILSCLYCAKVVKQEGYSAQ